MKRKEGERKDQSRHLVDLADAVRTDVLAVRSPPLLVLRAAPDAVPHLRRAPATAHARQ